MFGRCGAADVAAHVDVLRQRGLRVAEVLGDSAGTDTGHVEPGRRGLTERMCRDALVTQTVPVLAPDVLNVHGIPHAHPNGWEHDVGVPLADPPLRPGDACRGDD